MRNIKFITTTSGYYIRGLFLGTHIYETLPHREDGPAIGEKYFLEGLLFSKKDYDKIIKVSKTHIRNPDNFICAKCNSYIFSPTSCEEMIMKKVLQ